MICTSVISLFILLYTKKSYKSNKNSKNIKKREPYAALWYLISVAATKKGAQDDNG